MSLKAALLATLTLLSGCSLLSPSGPSDVARGEYYSAGKPEFDSFFIALHAKQVELLAAPREPKEARQSLTQMLNLTPEASDDSLRQRLRQELAKLGGQGLRVRLDVPPASTSLDASATLFASDNNTATALRAGLPQEATRLVRSRNRMQANISELEKLTVAGITLDGKIDQTFRVEGPWKRDEVRRNLNDGQKLITLMKARAQEVADLDMRLLSLLAEVANTDANLGKAPAYVPPAEEAPRPRRSNARSGGPQRSNQGAAKPPPAAKPRAAPSAGREDAPPAPKPTRGNAPAEIEP